MLKKGCSKALSSFHSNQIVAGSTKFDKLKCYWNINNFLLKILSTSLPQNSVATQNGICFEPIYIWFFASKSLQLVRLHHVVQSNIWSSDMPQPCSTFQSDAYHKKWNIYGVLVARVSFSFLTSVPPLYFLIPPFPLVSNYSLKWRWIDQDIHQAANAARWIYWAFHQHWGE